MSHFRKWRSWSAAGSPGRQAGWVRKNFFFSIPTKVPPQFDTQFTGPSTATSSVKGSEDTVPNSLERNIRARDSEKGARGGEQKTQSLSLAGPVRREICGKGTISISHFIFFSFRARKVIEVKGEIGPTREQWGMVKRGRKLHTGVEPVMTSPSSDMLRVMPRLMMTAHACGRRCRTPNKKIEGKIQRREDAGSSNVFLKIFRDGVRRTRHPSNEHCRAEPIVSSTSTLCTWKLSETACGEAGVV